MKANHKIIYVYASWLQLKEPVIPYFRLSKLQATKIINQVVAVVKTWREEANNIGIAKNQQEQMARAFRVADARIEFN